MHIAFQQPHKDNLQFLVCHDFHALDSLAELPVPETTAHELVEILELSLLFSSHHLLKNLKELALL